MSKRHRLWCLIIATITLLLVIACDVDIQVDKAPAEARAAIAEQSKRFSQAYVQGDIHALVDIYTQDGIAATGGRDFIQGKPALEQFWRLPPGRTILQHQSNSLHLDIKGDTAYDWGYYSGQAAQDGEALPPFQGKYVIIWQKGEDNQWRMLMDMWNSMPSEST